jgi:TBC1 domain family protein 5
MFEPDEGCETTAVQGRSGVEVDNPLSLADDSPWQPHFERLTAFEQIGKDVQRTFPEERDRFLSGVDTTSDSFHRQMCGVLATWSLIEDNVHVGYRQGMHEIAAVCWLAVKEDASDEVDRRAMEADTFTLFDVLMKRALSFYIWRPTAAASSSSTSLPILQRCEVIQESLQASDPALFRFLASNRIAVQLFAIRWLRLLFLRELQLDTAMELWDALFDVDASLHLMDHVCVALLIRMRDTVMQSSHTECLQVLMATQDNFIQPGESVHALVREARQVHRRFTAVRSGYVSLSEQRTEGYGGQRDDRDAGVFQAAASYLGSRGPAVVNAQSLGAGFSKAFDTVQRTAYAAYQAHMQPKNAHSDGFPPSMSSLSSYPNNNRRPQGAAALQSSFARLSSTPYTITPAHTESSSGEGSPQASSVQAGSAPPTSSFDPLGANTVL